MDVLIRGMCNTYGESDQLVSSLRLSCTLSEDYAYDAPRKFHASSRQDVPVWMCTEESIMPPGAQNLMNSVHKAETAKLSELFLDYDNPRFGDLDSGAKQEAIVDLIVDRFGVEDVLSSLAVNGFFSAEPLVCEERPDGTLVVREGNRRLCASIIITGDPRGKNQSHLHARYSKLWNENGSKPIEPLAVLKFPVPEAGNNDLLAYLGVRHIAASQPWDSYAKAAWVAKLQDSSNLTEAKISEMIGDNHSTVVRLLEGYRFVQQLIAIDKFIPSDSQRKGRGSVTEYPFSWVYTMLGFRSARDYCGLAEVSGKKNPIPETHIDKASDLLRACFGSKALGRSAAIDDSRQLLSLAQAMNRPEVAKLINAGQTLSSAAEQTKPVEQRLSENLDKARDLLTNILTGLGETPPPPEIAGQYVEGATIVRRISVEIQKKLSEIMLGDADD